MFGTLSLGYRIVGILAIGAAILLAGIFIGYRHEHDSLVALESKVAQAAADQVKSDKEKEALYERNLNEANKNTTNAAQSISDYYHAHPSIRVLHDSSCSVSQANDNSQGTNDSTTDSNVATYISQYSPESSEQVASQLDQLQKLLIANGVQIK